jgi:NAD+ synthase (glutamine-hydrolysing)
MLRIALAQINLTVGDIDGNQRKIYASIHQAKVMGADIVAFPELAITGYPPEDLLYKPHFIDANVKAVEELAKKVTGIVAIVGFADKKGGKIYNAAAVISDGKVKGIYRKEELPNYGVFDEKRYFHQGRDNVLFMVNGVTFGVNICEDIWLDGGNYLKQAKAGADLIINISSSPYEVGKVSVRETLLRKRVQETETFLCYANLIGGQDELVFDGGSFVFNPKGELIAFGKQFEEDLVIADLDITPGTSQLLKDAIDVSFKKSKTTPPPVVPAKIRKMDETEEMYRALVLGTHDYVTKNGFKKVVIGLSGGIDSALVAVIACDAIGKDNVIGISMPTQFNSKGTRSDARKLAANLGIEFHEIPIKRVLASYLTTLVPWFVDTKTGIAEENLQARIRGNILMAFSNKFNWLVLTTGNKSEMAVGYCTLYGDMSGGFAVIKDILKTKVYELSRFRNNREGKMLIPKSIFLRAPSAELRENQKDQDSLPPYDELDALLAQYVEKHESLAQMMAQTKERSGDPKVCQKVSKLVDQSEYKRRQSPPGIKITSRAFGKDWRLPITNQYKES